MAVHGADRERDDIESFSKIYEHCLEEGYDVTKECIPVVPAQHYFMGGIWVDKNSHTSMPQLFAVGEMSGNGVHERTVWQATLFWRVLYLQKERQILSKSNGAWKKNRLYKMKE